ncbi:PhoH family protein [Pseudidiomarina sp. 1ASP75-14]|uniref:PhoH family protein n=1 Tax=Pseudidiomarina terrestris TaxID=2820060 RepID=UPI00264A553D|nr:MULTISPECIES: PhoH family protein [unclassified Pseudidiomarina]MDN7127358.1 PhoH family protein [Pseudidiomarina sp. 1APR75-33.1]MDN7138322.1 PhoH family protein [Pseudidiomarina sp. 1ASP75-14]
MTETMPKYYLLDTNILLHEPLAFLNFEEHNVIIPMVVLEELDNIKDRHKDVSREARVAIRSLEDALKDASPEEIIEGVPLNRIQGAHRAEGTLAIFPDYQLKQTESVLNLSENDHRIIQAALELQKTKRNAKIVLVTKDINMRLKAKGAGVKFVEDYRTDQLIDDIRFLSKGFVELEGDFWQSVGEVTSVQEGRETFHELNRDILPTVFRNQYLIDETEHFAAKVVGYGDELVRLHDLGFERMMSYHAWGIHPKNIYQAMAMNALLDPTIDLVILTGPAGSGKTLLALASALELVIEQGIYEKIIVTRNTPEIAESIGYLPGTEEEKMAPWLAAITDSLEVLHKNDESMESSLNYIMNKANIQFKSLNFMRGRSIQNAIVLLDESQNLTASQLKTIITRCGTGTKIICSGNLAQIDSYYLTAVTSGLTYIVERFKDYPGSATVNLNGVVRSSLAQYAEENL